ncbi:MAG: Ger(x)C family spore germination C-terminal domain-containing protein [Clostridia bacterium]|nr:Ger(x)C family spore germination C-terminal domain-containing protein [Clostridia bacterium]
MTRLVSKTTAPITGMIRLKEEGERIDLEFMGTAVFEEDKLIGMLDEKETRGLLWVLGEIESNTVVVDSADQTGKIGVEILKSNSKIKPEMKNGEFSIKIDVTTSGRVVELIGREDITDVKIFKALEERMADTIKEEILLSIKKSKALRADTFGFGDEINKIYHKEFEKIEGAWQEIFPKTEVNVEVEAKILGIGTILKTFE